MIYRYRIVPLLVALVLLAGCQIGAAPLSQQQLQEYLQKYQIQPQLIENVGDVTVILFKTPKTLGCHTVWSRSGIEADQQSTYLTGLQSNTTLQPITAIRNDGFSTDIICLTINDQVLRQQAQTIKLIFSDTNEEMIIPVQSQENMIVHRKLNMIPKRTEMILYDKNQIELKRQSFFN